MRFGQKISGRLFGRTMRCGRSAIEESWDWYAKSVGNLVQAAGADPIGTLLVFLDLLERSTDLLPEFRLGETLVEPAKTDVLTRQDINRHRTSCGHSNPSKSILIFA